MNNRWKDPGYLTPASMLLAGYGIEDAQVRFGLNWETLAWKVAMSAKTLGPEHGEHLQRCLRLIRKRITTS